LLIFFLTGHSGPITAISFSENGYYLATSADDCCVKLWDLRKLKNFKTLVMDDGYEIKDLCFDQSGTYLGVAGTDVRLVKIINTILKYIAHILLSILFSVFICVSNGKN